VLVLHRRESISLRERTEQLSGSLMSSDDVLELIDLARSKERSKKLLSELLDGVLKHLVAEPGALAGPLAQHHHVEHSVDVVLLVMTFCAILAPQ
jgi:hypothetical protein